MQHPSADAWALHASLTDIILAANYFCVPVICISRSLLIADPGLRSDKSGTVATFLSAA